jgi:NAD(P)H dehydrogenase (quinone)
LVLAPEHLATEDIIRGSSLAWTMLRNGWYTENYVDYMAVVQQARVTGEIVSSVGDGRVASTTRRDLAEAAAVVLSEPGHEGRVYELNGDRAWGYGELAEVVSEIIDSDVRWRDLSPEEHREYLLAAGVDGMGAEVILALDADIRAGFMAEADGTLSRLIGRPTTDLREGLAGAVAAAEA